MTKKMSGFASNSVYLWGQRTTMPYKGLPPGRWIQFDNEDIPAVSRLPGVQYLAPRDQLGGWRDDNSVTRNGKAGSFQVFGDYPDFQHILNMEMIAGRFVDHLDLQNRRKIAVIGRGVYEQLFEPGEDPIGQHIEIKGVYFQVVGLFEPVSSGDDQDRQLNSIIVPFTTFQQAFNYGHKVNFFAMAVDPRWSATAVEDSVKRVLAERHKVSPDDKEGVGSFNWAEKFKKIQIVFFSIELFAWIASLLTLLAGALGVSNILLITVKERTKEIGVRKALGATPGLIVRMIMQESVVLTAVAGYFGLLAGVGFCAVIDAMVGQGGGSLAPPRVDFHMAILSLAILVGAGALAGLIPARHASRIPPVEALRAE